MARATWTLETPLWEYLHSVSTREPELLQRLRHETEPLERGYMQISPEQGQFMAFLCKLIGATNVLEVGVFTGYSSTCVALSLPPNGRITACDVSEEWTAMARRYWAEAGVSDKIDLHLAPAVETLDALLASGKADTYDFAFIDADKSNYDNYYERSLKLVRRGGLIIFDNVLWFGKVLDATLNDVDTLAIRAFNDKLHHDDRVDLSMVPIGDGVTLVRRR
jgi:predicted O-methyltransferase YrrM